MKTIHGWWMALAVVCSGVMVIGLVKADVIQAGGPSVTAGDYLVVDLSGGPEATNYPVSHLAEVPSGGWTDDYKTAKLVLREIPAGTFMMGSPAGECGRESDEKRHQVTLSKNFYIGVFEVTQKQWERVMGEWLSHLTNAVYRDSRPVEQVSYHYVRGGAAGMRWPADGGVDGDSFMGRLRAKTGKAFDLPTEAQWEYACRAGTVTSLNSGSDITNAFHDASASVLGRCGYPEGFPDRASDLGAGSAKVGSYLPNAWGLYDMHGNVWEWCLDCWVVNYPGAAKDPKGGVSDLRVIRGGDYSSGANSCRSANRCGTLPSNRWSFSGFRVALVEDWQR